ncbi:MAG TPA: isoprenylcysteine carboxylmethyltransferase family protein [Vitreimonas sp.]|uniref:methyltransferase family protein n=1 Tax=Vitreimonas sp. TaxID=3069702 RepID=UPI002D3B211D|nr:isoprenylcysteine carboxylmethyltransferase family protein [Vitreimonas sp.]HYD86356.1 isoprenylcysteine carboxylmethyltransferase family protein [Vitreimonas sp.]
MSPSAAIVAAWIFWLVSWILAAGWSARTASRADLGAQSPSRVLTLAAVVMMIAAYWPAPWGVLWTTPVVIGWAMLALAVIGFAFAWAARLHLGPLWSDAAAPTEAHRIVDTGPYGIVRHPVYAGLLLAALATAIERGRIEALAGALVLVAAVSLRAKLEERFLRRDLGAEAYASYRARVPMLLPFAKFGAAASARRSGGG